MMINRDALTLLPKSSVSLLQKIPHCCLP